MTTPLPSLKALLLAASTTWALSASAATVDVPLLRFAWTPAELAAACEKAETDTDAALAKILAIPAAERTFQNTYVALDNVTGDYSEAVARLSFMKDMHKDAAVRDAGAACEERAGKYGVALAARDDLYQAAKATKLDSALTPEQKRLVEVMNLEWKKNGLLLSAKDRQKLVEIRSKLTELSSKFSKNLGEDKSAITVTKEELEGLPEDFVKAHVDPKDSNKYVITTKYPDYYPVMENARREETRKKLEVAFMNRGGKENLALMNEAVKLRQQAAKLLGHKTHVDVVAEDRMAKNAKTIGDFLTRLKKGLAPALAAQTKDMVALKAKETGKPEAQTKINAWDWRYYLNQIKQRDYSIDDEKVRSYFPTDTVLAGMFTVYERLFGVSFQEVKGAAVWADGVKLYEVRDGKSKELLARFSIDLYPREGKYGHAAEFTLSAGHDVAGGYRIPSAALVVNFAPAEKGKPSYLSMNEVDTLFHEFGHVMHETLTTAKYSALSGTRTALDFVEAPSQMLENWCFEPEVLALISKDPADPKKPLPADLADKLKKARKYDAAVKYSRQIFLGSFDYAIHTANGNVDVDAVAKKTWADIMHFPEDKDAHFAGTFGHMMGGYEGGYYGYAWSEVFAADMFTRFQKEGVLNEKAGRDYRDLVISRGRVLPPDELLKNFLGRAPSEEAFLQGLGIETAKAK
jgi:Zn-dependent oligopeptidase